MIESQTTFAVAAPLQHAQVEEVCISDKRKLSAFLPLLQVSHVPLPCTLSGY